MTDPAPEPTPGEGETTPEGEPEPTPEPTPDEADEDEAAAEDEGEAEPPPPQSSYTVSEALNRKLETERKRHARAIEKLVGEYDQDAMPCPVCERPELAPLVVAQLQAIPAESWQQLAGQLGIDLDVPHREAEGVHMCDRCDGWGELDYPTRNPHMARQMCPRCAGNGYLPDDQAEQPAPVITLPTFTAAPPEGGVAIGGTPDNWGRPAGHPHWGQDPAAVGV